MKKKINYMDDDCEFGVMISRDVHAQDEMRKNNKKGGIKLNLGKKKATVLSLSKKLGRGLRKQVSIMKKNKVGIASSSTDKMNETTDELKASSSQVDQNQQEKIDDSNVTDQQELSIRENEDGPESPGGESWQVESPQRN